ncbi:pimeloyl-CoA biosynthesis protein BioC [Arboricoccus pini]|uniref:Pimeloyl-CoA biosynthesis protein BioC n=1 Tax=Arboricoccus pini TaxID=1963835 RepID=A0A212RXQ5_9PROT|nr:class I SAM-dependent methyltransferase [Arboricoccus pini]SNB77475.1 pimeloyl-CoA biosynthesis protein BioC [Arboricoccus pini]
MSSRTQEAVSKAQYGGRAEAYLKSAVHRAGPDLQAMAARLEGHRTARLLDLGCGGGHLAFTAAPLVAEVTAYDLSPEMVAVVDRHAAENGLHNIKTETGGAEHLPFEDGSFDIVATRFSAHHWRDFDAGIAEAARVLKPGGIALLADTISPGPAILDTFMQSIEVLRDTSHVRNRTRAEWEAVVEAAGLVPGAFTPFRLRLDFASWTERMRTPTEFVVAMRRLQKAMADEVRAHFAIEADGSFTIDTMLLEAAKPAA